MSGAHDLQFGPFHLAPGDERLWRGDEAIVLRPKSFAVLCYLVERAGRSTISRISAGARRRIGGPQ